MPIPGGASIEETDDHHEMGDSITRLFFLRGAVSAVDLERLAANVLCDPVTEQFALMGVDVAYPLPGVEHSIEVSLLPGVTDPVAENLIKVAALMGMEGIEQAATGQRHLIRQPLEAADLHRLARQQFSNPVIQVYEIDRPISPPFVEWHAADDTVDVIPIREADGDTLLAISADRRLALNLDEMKAIRSYFESEERDPTDVELETVAQTWSEHCVHKTFRATINYRGPAPGADADTPPIQQQIDGLLRTYIRRATETINKPWVYSAFVDNAGIIAFTEAYDLAFKVETHNHPSALEPFGGANTGSGGVIRDILGVSARPIANTDVLCFGPQDLPDERLPEGVLHPQRIQEGVVHGIEDYGNKMGIPTVNGAVYYHPDYTANPLVFCGCLGLLPHDTHPSEVQPGDLIVVIGGRTGRDGLRGATFSSMEMDQSTGEIAGSAVQIGHPINEKQAQEVVLQARDEELYHAITDCGAGGLSSAIGEMGQDTGAEVQLQSVLLKYPGLRPWEIWLSEAQERMVMAVPPENWDRLQAIAHKHDIDAICVGTFQNDGRLKLYYGEKLVGELSMQFLHEGLPPRFLEAVWQPPDLPTPPDYGQPGDISESLLSLLAHPNIRSKEAIIRRYDHEVQSGTAVKPLVGKAQHGPGDATVLVPLDSLNASETPTGVVLSAGMCPAYSDHDPYWMAWATVDEALRNAVAVGADPDLIALLDNFCWGNPDFPDRLGSLTRAAMGCHDAAVAYGAPFISGKDSLNNEFVDENGEKHAIPGTLLISAVGVVPDVNQTTTMDLKTPGNLLYVVGETREELGGSHYGLISGFVGGQVPKPQENPLNILRAIHKAIRAGIVRGCHDCSEGGIGVALAEMCLAGRLGAEIDLGPLAEASHIERDDLLLFSESTTRFIVEVRPEDASVFGGFFSNLPLTPIGRVDEDSILRITGRNDEEIALLVAELEQAWRGDLPVAESANSADRPSARSMPAAHTGSKRVAILHAKGTNRDRDALLACELAGGQPEIVTISDLMEGQARLDDYHMLVIPGGFSYGDDLGAGVLWAFTMQHWLGQDLAAFVDSGRPVMGICNGFQVLVKMGLLPGHDFLANGHRPVTLTHNKRGRFECRWVYLRANPDSPCLFTDGLDTLIYCPVAHGEGRLMVQDGEILNRLQTENLAALTYVDPAGRPADYPGNPNGSLGGIAALTNAQGNILGLMPHPENHIFPWQHPHRHRGVAGMSGLHLFENGLKRA